MFRSKTKNDQVSGLRGQATLELLISSTVLTVLVAGAGWIIKAEWDRGKCAYLVFEKTHAELTEEDEGEESQLRPLSSLVSKASEIQITDTTEEVAGAGHCGGASETLHLRKLEAVSW